MLVQVTAIYLTPKYKSSGAGNFIIVCSIVIIILFFIAYFVYFKS